MVKKTEFLQTLAKYLGSMSPAEREKFIAYYDEMLSDRVEDGMTEDDAIESLEPIDVIAQRILSESDTGAPNIPPVIIKRRNGIGTTILLILGSPIWLSLVVAFAAVVFSLLVTIWALWLSLLLCAAVMSIGGIFGIIQAGVIMFTNIASSVFTLGCAIICFALGGMLGKVIYQSTSPVIRFSKIMMTRWFRRKGGDR